MDRSFFAAICLIAAVAIAAPSVWGSVPDPANCGVYWSSLVCGDDKVFVCPCGAGTGFTVRIMDQFNAPMAGVPVEVMFVPVDNDSGDCILTWAPYQPFVGFTDANGEVNFPLYCGIHRNLYGGDYARSRYCCRVATQIKCYGIPISLGTKEWLSPDINCVNPLTVGKVEGLDYAVFALDWLSDACRTDFNCDGFVEGQDYSIFALSWLHEFP